MRKDTGQDKHRPHPPICSASLVAQIVKNPPTMWETLVRSLDWEDPLEKRNGNPLQYSWASLVAQMVKKKKNTSACNEGDLGLIPWLGKIP